MCIYTKKYTRNARCADTRGNHDSIEFGVGSLETASFGDPHNVWALMITNLVVLDSLSYASIGSLI